MWFKIIISIFIVWELGQYNSVIDSTCSRQPSLPEGGALLRCQRVLQVVVVVVGWGGGGLSDLVPVKAEWWRGQQPWDRAGPPDWLIQVLPVYGCGAAADFFLKTLMIMIWFLVCAELLKQLILLIGFWGTAFLQISVDDSKAAVTCSYASQRRHSMKSSLIFWSK